MIALPTILAMTQVAIGPLFFLFVAGVIVLLAAAMFLVLFVKSGKKGRWILAGVLSAIVLAPIVLLVVAIALPHVARARATHTQSQQIRHADQSRQVSIAEVRTKENRQQTTRSLQYQRSDGSSLPIAKILPFEPDIYASKESAVRAVTRLVSQQYKALITAPSQVPKSLQIAYSDSLIHGEPVNAGNAFGTVALRELEKVFGQTLGAYIDRCAKPPVPERAGYDDAVLYLSLQREPQSTAEMEETGRVEGTISGPLGRSTQYAEYVNKPWQEDFYRWRQRSQDAASWVFGESQDFCASREESIDRATQAVIPGIRVPVSREASRVYSQRTDWQDSQADLYKWVDQEASRRLKSGDLQTDVFTQEFKRPYGSVWRSAVLVHVPRDTAREMLNDYQLQTEARRSSWLRTFLSGAGLFAVILAVYLFLNMATRGYYVWSVRLATVVLAVVGGWYIMTFVR